MTGDAKRIATLKTSLLHSIRPHLVADGFKLNEAKTRFVRRRDGLVDVFPLICTNANPGYYVEPCVIVSIEQVEKIFHQASGFRAKTQNDTPTMGTLLGPLKEGRPTSYKFTLKTESDISCVTERIVQVFHEAALPYFDRWGSLTGIDAELNDNPENPSIHRGTAWLRCSTGLIVAKLVGRADYEHLVEFYSGIMSRDNKGFYLTRFQALVKSLEFVKKGNDTTK